MGRSAATVAGAVTLALLHQVSGEWALAVIAGVAMPHVAEKIAGLARGGGHQR